MPELEFESSGSSMSEVQSFEVIVDGLKLAIDSAKHLAAMLADRNWYKVAAALALLLKAFSERAGMGRPIEADMELPKESDFTVTQSFVRFIDGVRMASGGMRQMAVYHRMQEFWLEWVRSFDRMEQKAGVLLKRNVSPFLAMPGMMQ